MSSNFDDIMDLDSEIAGLLAGGLGNMLSNDIVSSLTNLEEPAPSLKTRSLSHGNMLNNKNAPSNAPPAVVEQSPKKRHHSISTELNTPTPSSTSTSSNPTTKNATSTTDSNSSNDNVKTIEKENTIVEEKCDKTENISSPPQENQTEEPTPTLKPEEKVKIVNKHLGPKKVTVKRNNTLLLMDQAESFLKGEANESALEKAEKEKAEKEQAATEKAEKEKIEESKRASQALAKKEKEEQIKKEMAAKEEAAEKEKKEKLEREKQEREEKIKREQEEQKIKLQQEMEAQTKKNAEVATQDTKDRLSQLKMRLALLEQRKATLSKNV